MFEQKLLATTVPQQGGQSPPGTRPMPDQEIRIPISEGGSQLIHTSHQKLVP
jgi:hypothetical protein